MQPNNFLVIGEVFLDTFLDLDNNTLVRLGGIFNSVRGFSGIDSEVYMAYFAPNYLEKDITCFSKKLGVKSKYCMGIIDRCPNVNLINYSKESKPIEYDLLLRKQKEIENTFNKEELTNFIIKNKIGNILIFPGSYNIKPILNILEQIKLINIHIDFHYQSENIINCLTKTIKTAFLSTSSDFFKEECENSIQKAKKIFNSSICEQIIIKENRGGSCCFNNTDNTIIETPAFLGKTKHSVGVGDCYNSIFLYFRDTLNIEAALKIASYCSGIYAKILDQEEFKRHCKVVLKNKDNILNLFGKRLPWDKRKNIDIYIAAPDFPSIDTRLLDDLEVALRNHNFTPHRPIKENGLATTDLSIQEETEIFHKDISLLDECSLMISVLLNNDPGTLVEIGTYISKGKKVILLDPFYLAENMFLKKSISNICYTIDETIDILYKIVSTDEK